MDRGILTIFFLGLLACIASGQQLDPIVNFCRRVNHQSVVTNGVLYIDGGQSTFINVNNEGNQYGNITQGINEYLITVDMSSSWNWRTNISMTAFKKENSTNTNSAVPNLIRGALYEGPSNNSRIYSFGGTTTYSNVSFPGWVGPTSNQYPLWSYENSTSEWNAIDLSADQIVRPASGASAEAPDQGLGFWYNGEQDSGSSTESQSFGDGIRKFLSGMIVIDFNTGRAKNISTEAVSNQPRVRGKMVYIPGMGERGALVLIGGGEKGASYNNADWHGTLVSMDQIYVFDIASLYDTNTPNGTWYQQRASGTVPESRVDHCLVLVSAQDGSSHNIYMYGGRDGTDQYFDDVYVLSLPSFSWIRIYSGESPRYGMTCHTVGNRQMLTVGGSSSSSVARDCDWETKSVAIYDLSTLLWGSTFDYNAPPYEVPKLVRDVIGGGPAGNASLVQPTGGFTATGLAAMFSPQSTNTTSSSVPFETTSPASSSTGTPESKSNTGAIAGGVVGGIAAIALIGLGAFLFRRRRIKQNLAAASPLYEASGRNVVEKDGSAVKTNNELLADTHYTPLASPAELPGGISIHPPQELNSANYNRDMD